MEVFLAAVVLVGIGIFGMCINIIFRKNGEFPQTDVGLNENMRKLGIRCMREEDDEWFSGQGKTGTSASCSGTYGDACIGCGLYPRQREDSKGGGEG